MKTGLGKLQTSFTPIRSLVNVISSAFSRADFFHYHHNHPAGGLTPSREDIQITKRLKAAGETLGIKLLDHMIFNHKGYYSFLEKGEI